MSEFSNLDFEILNCISENEPVNLELIKAELPNVDSLEYRLETMSRQEYSETTHSYISNTSLISQKYEVSGAGLREIRKPTGIYVITDYGRKILQDHKNQTSEQVKELWIKNAWIPILVSVATNLVISGLKQLWPLMQQWISSFR